MVNGMMCFVDVELWILLVYFLCDELGLTGINIGCDISSCGVCIVLVDG